MDTAIMDARPDDVMFCEYLVRDFSLTDADTVVCSITAALAGGCFEAPSLCLQSKCDELRLICDIFSHRISREEYEWTFPSYLSAFRSLSSHSLLPPMSWDNDFHQLYELYLKSPSGRYHQTTASIAQAFVRRSGLEAVRILDLGCGSGALLSGVVDDSTCGFHCICVDSNRDALRKVKMLIPECEVIHSDLSCIHEDPAALGMGQVDIVFASMSLHHLGSVEKRRICSWVKQVLRPGGLLVVNEMYGGFEGLPPDSFRLIFNVVKYYSLESHLIWSHFQNAGDSNGIERMLYEFFGREIASLIGPTATQPPPEACIYPEEWCALLKDAGFRLLPIGYDGLPKASRTDLSRYLTTCGFNGVRSDSAIPLLYTVCATPTASAHSGQHELS